MTKLSKQTFKFGLRIFNLMGIAVLLILIGAALNIFVVSENDCRMPVWLPYNISTDSHFSFTDFNKIEYPSLTDIFRIRLSQHYLNFSIGDILVVLGIFIMFFVFGILVNYKNKLRLFKTNG